MLFLNKDILFKTNSVEHRVFPQTLSKIMGTHWTRVLKFLLYVKIGSLTLPSMSKIEEMPNSLYCKSIAIN